MFSPIDAVRPEFINIGAIFEEMWNKLVIFNIYKCGLCPLSRYPFSVDYDLEQMPIVHGEKDLSPYLV